MKIKNGSIIFCSSPFRFKTLLTKPIRYIIHLFTKSQIEHAVLYAGGKILHISGDGTIFIAKKEWIDIHVDEAMKLYSLAPLHDLTNKQFTDLIKFCKSKVGTKYSIIEAIVSNLDEIKQIRKLDIDHFKKNFCSQLSFDALVEIGLFPKQKDKLSPVELYKKLTKSGIYEKKWRRIK